MQQLLMRTHHGMGGMVGLAGIAALASGAAYHDAPGTGTQATPPTTQSTTQTVQNTVQSTTQTSPSVSTAQTNTTHTGDVIPSRPIQPETTATGTNTLVGNETDERTVATVTSNNEANNSDKSNTVGSRGDNDIKIEEIARKNSTSETKVVRSSNSATDLNDQVTSAGGPCDVISGKVETATLDRRRKDAVHLSEDDPPLVSNQEDPVTERLAPRVSTEADDLE